METTYNPDIKTTNIFVDEYDMVMGQNPDWKPDGDYGEGDSIGRTLRAYMAWKDPKFIEAVKKCFIVKVDEKTGEVYIEGYRHPKRVGSMFNDMSRDHILNMLVFMKLVNDPFLDDLIEKLRWKISDRFTFTPDLWLWMMGLNGYKFDRFMYYFIAIPVQTISVLWTKFVCLIGGFKPEVHQDDFVPTRSKDLSKWKLYWRKKIYPYFHLFQVGFMLYVMPDSRGKRIMKRICLWGTPNQNFVMKILFDGKVTKEEVYGYKSMRGGRWSGILNEINNRDLTIITEPELLEANQLDVDFLRTLYEEYRQTG